MDVSPLKSGAPPLAVIAPPMSEVICFVAMPAVESVARSVWLSETSRGSRIEPPLRASIEEL